MRLFIHENKRDSKFYSYFRVRVLEKMNGGAITFFLMG